MRLRAWLIRVALVALLAGAGATVWHFQSYVSPDAVRASLIAALGEQFADVDVKVGTARMRVFGGILVTDLQLTRKGDAEPFFSAPSAVIYHDKEQINSGRLAVRKIEVENPTLRLERAADGTWNLAGLGKAGPADQPIPTFVITKATVHVRDRVPNGLPALTLTEARLTLLNDPLPVLKADGIATITVHPADGPTVSVLAAVGLRVNRVSGQAQLSVELPELPITPELVSLAAGVHASAESLRPLAGRVSLKADATYEPGQPVRYDLRAHLTDGRYEHASLPWPVTKLDVAARLRNGKLTVEKATANLGPATAELSLETRDAAPGADLEDRLERLTLQLRDLPISDDLFERLPAKARELKTMFAPSGPVHANYTFTRPAGGWTRQLDVRPAGLKITYEKFRYPLTEVSGLVRKTTTHAGTDDLRIDLSGTAGGQRIDIAGNINGPSPDPALDLKISGTNIPIDDALFDALPDEKYAAALKRLHAGGRGDFVAEVRGKLGVNVTENSFRINVYDGRLSYEAFPYPLEQVRGKIAIATNSSNPTRPAYPDRPNYVPPDTDRVELRDFEGRHGAGVVTLYGVNEAIAGCDDRKMTLKIWGKDCPIDASLRAALAAIKLEPVWRTFQPRGAITFGIDVAIVDRAAVEPTPPPTAGPAAQRGPRASLTSRKKVSPAFVPAADLTMTLNFRGPTVTPDFFAYELADLAGKLRFDGSRVFLEQFLGKHGASVWKMNAGEVRFYDNGRVWANLGGLSAVPFAVDADFTNALPGKLRSAAETLKLRGPAELSVSHLVVLTPPDEPRPLPALPTVARAQSPDAPDPEVYWVGELKLLGASLDAGLAWDDVRGRIACRGNYLGTHLGDVAGNLWIDRAAVAEHPVSAVSASFLARPQLPDPTKPGSFAPPALEFPDLAGTLFRGKVGGEARVVLADPLRYRVSLTVQDVQLAEVARHHNLGTTTRLEGSAQGRVELETRPDPATGELALSGKGAADILNGHILNLKWLLPLLKTLKLQAPDKTAFEEAHANFTLKGDRVRIDHLDLLGNAVSLGGSGETDTRGEYLKFELYTIWSQTLQRWLTTPFGDVTAFVSEQLFKIEVSRGPDGKIKYEPHVVPFVTDPFRAVAERVRNRAPTARAAPR